MNEDDYSDKYMRGAPCKHYICEAHANNIYGGANADWRSAAQARLATVLAATDGPARGDARPKVEPCGDVRERGRLQPPHSPQQASVLMTMSACIGSRVHAACRRSCVATATAVRPLSPLSVVAYVGPVRRPSEGVPQTPL